MKKRKTLWRLWAKALGDKAGKDDKESDTIAIIRTFVFITYLTTNVAIVANAIRHWNDKTTVQVIIDASALPIYQTPLNDRVNKNLEFE